MHNSHFHNTDEADSCQASQLLDTHFEQLHTLSAISVEVIKERQYQSILGRKQLADLGFGKAQRLIPSILIPLWGVDANHIVGYQHKPDNPRIVREKLVKYETPIGATNRLDCPPRCRARLRDPSTPLWVTEGVKKADCLASLGECVIDVSGVWSWKGRNELRGITISSDFDYLALNNRQVYLVFDSDFISNPNVRQACSRLAEHLTRKGAIVFIVHLPQEGAEKVGIDDFIVSGHSLDEVKALARPLEQEVELDKKAGENKVYLSYLYADNRLYLEVMKIDGTHTFTYLKDSGEVGFTQEVAFRDKAAIPRPLPVKDGIPKFIVKMPSEDIAYSRLLSPGELYYELKAHFEKYIDLPELDIQLCVYYAIFTWFYPKVNTLGYLRFLADTGKGKSRIQTVVGDVCFYPLYAGGASSFSGMARLQDKWRGTLVIDESDFSGDKDAQITKYLNLGFEKGKYYVLTDKQDPKKQEVFDPFCPKIMAMRQPFSDNAVEGRLLSMSPHETFNTNIPILLLSDYQGETLALRNKMALFTLHYWGKVKSERMLSFNDTKLEPRLKQLGMPLSVIFQIWPEGAKPFREYLVKRQQEVKEIRSQSWEGSLFNIVYSIAVGDLDLEDEYGSYYEPISKQIQGVTPSMVAKQIKSTTKTVTQSLNTIGFKVEKRWVTLYKSNEDSGLKEIKKQPRFYVVPSKRIWEEMVRRYHYNENENKQDELELPKILVSSKFVSSEASQPSHPSQKAESEQEFETLETDETHSNTRSPKNSRNFPQRPTKPCSVCGSNSWWQRPDGGWVCGRCHPCPNP